MPRKRGRKGQSKKKDEEADYDSDDPKAYSRMPKPDQKSDDYYHDAVDEFNSRRDRIALDAGLEPAESSSDDQQEEVLGLDDSDSDDDLEEKMRMVKRNKHLEEMASDLEDEGEDREDNEMPDAKAWGKRKQDFFDTDYVDDDLPGVSGSEEEDAREEEEREAIAIQQRMAEALDEGDFGLDLFKPKPVQKVEEKAEEEEEQKVTLDLSKLTKREKLQILKKESPEFLELVEDFKAKMSDVIDRLQPLHDMVKNGLIPPGPGAVYIKTKYNLCLGYCINISFYMVLKARHTPVHNHPIIGRILEYRKLLSELEPIDVKFADEMQHLIDTDGKDDDEGTTKATEDEHQSEDVQADTGKKAKTKKRKAASKMTEADDVQGNVIDDDEEPQHAKKAKRKKKSKSGKTDSSELTAEEQKALEYYESMARKLQSRRDDKEKALRELQGDEEDNADVAMGDEDEANDKRGISYQISKNRGLTARKRKELRTPRVKNRMKYKKAKVRRKGQVREVRKEMQRYGGEISGIRAGVIKSVKIK